MTDGRIPDRHGVDGLRARSREVPEKIAERPARTERKSKNTVLWGIILLGLLLLLGTAAGMIRTSYPDLISDAVAKLTFTDTASSEARPSQAPATDSYVGSEFGYQDVERLLETLTPVRRAEVLGDADAFDRLVREESVRQSVLEAARAAGFTQDARVIYLMERAAAQVLFNTFM